MRNIREDKVIARLDQIFWFIKSGTSRLAGQQSGDKLDQISEKLSFDRTEMLQDA
jgi:hypothetical protein